MPINLHDDLEADCRPELEHILGTASSKDQPSVRFRQLSFFHREDRHPRSQDPLRQITLFRRLPHPLATVWASVLVLRLLAQRNLEAADTTSMPRPTPAPFQSSSGRSTRAAAAICHRICIPCLS